jgi:PTS system mannose-specific IIC component
VTPTDLLSLAALGAVLGLDVVSFPQAMVSRPLVAATLAGTLLGAPADGLLAGVALELVALGTLPFGASRYPEWGSAAVVGGALYAGARATPAASLPLAVAGALAVAWVSGWSMVVLRRLNARRARALQARIDDGDGTAVASLHLRGLAADALRGGLVTLGGVGVLAPVAAVAQGATARAPEWATGVLLAALAAVGLRAVWTLIAGAPGARWLLAGGLTTAALLLRVLA